MVPVMLYSVFRASWYTNEHCWNLPIEGVEWLVQIPPLLALMINLFFIINVMRILLSKVRNKNDFEPYHFRCVTCYVLCVMCYVLCAMCYVVIFYYGLV
ncbi:hypothetical protein Avbf_09848 [Armadillidium vulgare]|nr:hypothetical protein Avbf_09848 [Armadillidium vulgare]